MAKGKNKSQFEFKSPDDCFSTIGLKSLGKIKLSKCESPCSFLKSHNLFCSPVFFRGLLKVLADEIVVLGSNMVSLHGVYNTGGSNVEISSRNGPSIVSIPLV